MEKQEKVIPSFVGKTEGFPLFSFYIYWWNRKKHVLTGCRGFAIMSQQSYLKINRRLRGVNDMKRTYQPSKRKHKTVHG
ncbi:50S ribosomal protein L34, partial [uncultured Dubosiella sp.]|uniref:large ribosomal subunit protein bL34 n=2 Tax=uncultured Dubosiella sp. TaxID=1937011 RepID=UPI003522707D